MASDIVLVDVEDAWWFDRECGDCGIQASMILWNGSRAQVARRQD